jgi:hypothetical protein
MSSRDFGFTTLRNVTAYQPNNLYVPQNRVLATSTNGAAIFSDNITISSLNASTIDVGTKTVQFLQVSTISSTTIVHRLNIQAGANDGVSGTGYISEFIRTSSSGTKTIEYQVASDGGTSGQWQDARYVSNPANSPAIAQVWGIVTSSNINLIGSTIGDIRFYQSVYADKKLEASSINTNDITVSNEIKILDGTSTCILDAEGSDLYVNGHRVLTGGTISTISSLYWSSVGATGTIYNDNIGIAPYYYRVGVGTNGTPLNATLDVLNTANANLNVFNVSSFANNFYIENVSSATSKDMIAILTNNQDNGVGPSFKFKKSINFNSTVSGTELGYLDFQGTTTSGTYGRGAYILGLQNGEASATYVPTDLQFITCTSTSGATRMTITNDGKVGIGTTTPIAPLTVNGTIICGSTNDGVLKLGNQTGNFYIESALSTISGSGNKLFFSNWDNHTTTMVINTSTQQVGIGTPNPQYALDIVGSTNITGILYSNLISSNLISSGTGLFGTLNVDTISSGITRSNLISSNLISSGTGLFGTLNVDTISSGIIRSNLISSNTISSGIITVGDYLSTNVIHMSTGQIIGVSTINGEVWPPLDDALWSKSGNNIYNDNSGNVGIGTSAPSEKLTVEGGVKFGSTSAGYMRFAFVNETSFIQPALTATDGSGGKLHFSQWASTDTTMAIDTGVHRVGINTTTPQYALEVAGTTHISTFLSTNTINMTNGVINGVSTIQVGTETISNQIVSVKLSNAINCNRFEYNGFDLVGVSDIPIIKLVDDSGVDKGDILEMTTDGGTGMNITILSAASDNLAKANTGSIQFSDDGTVGIGGIPLPATDNIKLKVYGNIQADNVVFPSDIRFKSNISTLINSLSTVKNMRGVSYTLNKNSIKQIGVIAQEVEKCLPEVVMTDSSPEQFKSVLYGNIVSVLIEAIKELSNEIDIIKTKLNI